MIGFKNRRGSLTVEASIALPVFIAVIVVLASVIKVVYTHNQIQYAVNEAAKEMSTYSYIYSVSGLQSAHDKTVDYLDQKQQTFGEHFTGGMEAFDSLKSKVGTVETEAQSVAEGNVEGIKNIKSTIDSAKDDLNTFKGIYDDIINHKDGAAVGLKKEAVSMASLFAYGTLEKAKGWVGGIFAKHLMKKHIEYGSVDANERLKRLGVIGGLDGLDFSRTTFLKDKKTIDIIVSYDIRPPVPFNLFPVVHITQRATVKAWLDGDGRWPSVKPAEKQIPEDYVWDPDDAIKRGNEIIEKFGGNVSARSTGGAVNRFDVDTGTAWNIRTMDLTCAQYQDKSGIEKKLKEEIDKIYNYNKKVVIQGDPNKTAYDIKNKKVMIVIPKNTKTKEFEKIFAEYKAYAKELGIELVLEEFGVVKQGEDSKESSTKEEGSDEDEEDRSKPGATGEETVLKVDAAYSRDAIKKNKSTQESINSIISPYGLDRDQFDSLRLDSTKYLTDEEKQKLRSIRNSIKIEENTIVQKVVPLSSIDAYVEGKQDWAKKVGGCVTRAQDTKDIRSYDDVYEGLRLDYENTRFNEGDKGYGVLRFKAEDTSSYKIPYNPDMGGSSIYKPPFTGNGFTKSKDKVIPEFEMKEQTIPKGTELYQVSESGQETLVAVYDGTRFVKVSK